MKKVFLVFAVLLSVTLLISCGDDDDKAPSSSSNSIVGRWKPVNAIRDMEDIVLELKIDGTMKESDDSSDNINFWYITTEGKLRIDWNCTLDWQKKYADRKDYIVDNRYYVDDYTSGTFKLDGNTLTYTYRWYDGNGTRPSEEETATYIRE